MQPTNRSTRRIAALAAMFAAICLANGCGTMTGDVLAKYTRGTEPLPPTEAPRDGWYALYSASDVKTASGYQLQKGDRLGFIRNADGKVVAVAGEKEITIATTTLIRSWAWKLEKTPG